MGKSFFDQRTHKGSILDLITGVLMGIVVIISVLFLFYINLISSEIEYLIFKFYKIRRTVPFYLSVLIGIFLFPFAIFLIIFVELYKLIK